ncbi:MAG: ComEA family DNA-binding protein [Chloroflexota bacterium]|nr:ComEA family DNA-binding protein [Chloroflexota bacterium]
MTTWLERHKKLVFVALLIVIVIGCVMLTYRRPWARSGLEIVLSEPSCTVTCCVIGEVESPGIFALDGCGLCVADAIDAAGGPTACADLDCLDTTAPLYNGDIIAVPEESDAPQRVDLNTADAWLLEALPGIGPALAGRIVSYRHDNGPFGTTEELMSVEGVGQATYDSIKGLVTVR